jgi:UDP-N-acetylmuramoyl-tripeptide--D-alanyl-D-alanine ligase
MKPTPAPIEYLYSLFLVHPTISTDSRHISTGSLFFALKGETFDGNAFASEALKKGAAYAIVDDPALPDNEHFIWVENVLESLQHLARHHRRHVDIPVIAITGTNGKTTTKELVKRVLSTTFRTLATEGNLNNHIGVPLTLLRIGSDTQAAIIEMGANHPGEIDALCRIAEPGFGLITNIGKAHLEGFGGFEGVIRTKSEMYRYINESRGRIFINSADPLLRELSAGIPSIPYGRQSGNAEPELERWDPFISFTLRLPDAEPIAIQTRLYGGYNLDNVLAAACIGHYFGVTPENIRVALEGYEPGNNRSQISDTGKNLLILDAYNANPSSMAAALKTFAESAYSQKMVILGDMLELGNESDSEHEKILELLDEYRFSHVYLVGPSFTRLNTKRENTCFDDSSLAAIWFEHFTISGMAILIKGSRGIKLEKLTGCF